MNAGATSGNSMAISLTPTNGFTGTVNLSCVVNTNITNPTDLPGCALSPAALNITGTTKVTSTLTVSTTAPTGVALGPGPFRIGGLTGLLALLFWFGIPRRRTAWLRMVIAIALPASIGVLGCGSGGGGSATSGQRQLRNNSRELLRYRDRDRCRNRKDHSPDDSERYCQWIAAVRIPLSAG